MKTEKFPEWKNAAEIILGRFDREGYGLVISHDEIDGYLHLRKPEVAGRDEHEKYNFAKWINTEALKKYLLEEHNLCLFSVHGEGYMILHPKDQVRIAAKKLIGKARNQIRKALATQTNINTEMLDNETQKILVNNLAKLAFLKSAFNKKKLLN